MRRATPSRWTVLVTSWTGLLCGLATVVIKLSTSTPSAQLESLVLVSNTSAQEEALASRGAERLGRNEATPPRQDEADTSLQPGFAFITVHSSKPARVYVMMKSYGLVEEKLAIPCGRQFVSIGIPVRGRKQPVWLAPGKMLQVPCQESMELTMNPRPLK